MKIKKIFMILFAAALLVSLFSIQTFAATQYTITIKSNDGSETLWTKTVDSGSQFKIMNFGVWIVGQSEADSYNYSGSRQFLGLATSANATTVSSFYAVGYAGTITSNQTFYVVDADRMGAHTIVGNLITGADTYELWQKDVSLTRVHPECGYYAIIKYSYRSNYVDPPQSASYYFVIVSSEVNTKFSSYDKYVEFVFPEGNKGYYQFDFETLEEAEAYLLEEHTVEAFTSFKIPDDSLGRGYSEDSFVYASGVYTYSSPGSSPAKKTSNKYYVFPYLKIAESSDLCFDLEDLGLAKGSYMFKVKAKGAGYYDSDFSNELTYNQQQKYTVTTSFTNLTAYNNYDSVGGFSYAFQNTPLSISLTPVYGYLQPDEVVVTMGGNTLKAGTGYYYNAKDGILVIPKVTGNITITAQGLLKVSAPSVNKMEAGVFGLFYPAVLKFDTVANASGYVPYINGVEVDPIDFEFTVDSNGVVVLKISKTAFSANGTYDIYVKALPVDGYMESNPSNTLTFDVSIYMIPIEIAEAPELETEDYLFAMKPISVLDPQVVGLEVYLNGVLCESAVIDWTNGAILIPADVFVGGDGTFEIYVVLLGPSGVTSDPSNTLTVTVAKLATPEIRLE